MDSPTGRSIADECRRKLGSRTMRANSRRLVVLGILATFLLLAQRLSPEPGWSWLLPIETMRRRIGASGHGRFGTRSRGERDDAGSAPAYAPGLYMAGRRPDNETSACRWRHGLPVILEYSAGGVIGSPEGRERGPYRVLPGVIRGETPESRLPDLTLCTHATADQVYHVVELARRWEGPLSLAVFAPGLDAGHAVALLERACRCEPRMSKVSVHLIFPAGRPPALSPTTGKRSLEGDCAASDLQLRESETERKQRGMTYPINAARNVAREYSPTSRVLVSDIELLPSDRLASGFVAAMEGRTPRAGVVFVVPTFEIEARERVPRNKGELLEALRAGLAVYFHRFVCLHCQRFPGLTRWILRPDPGRVRPLVVTRREYPYHRWEPVFIGTRDDPMYNEEMSWEGRQDKMGQMLEMCLMNYRLIVLDGAFLVHTPGIKRKRPAIGVGNEAREAPDRARERQNARAYQSLTRRLLKRHPVNRRCGR